MGYVGRHNKIKGYDRLVRMFTEMERKSIHVIVAGSKEGIKCPESPFWHELGYINDSQNLMNAVDVVVVPNRNTYFDLVILEALSRGKIVITSNTGGNISIAKETKAIVLFDNEKEELLDAIMRVKKLVKEERAEMEQDAILFYESKCSCEAFARGYLDVLNKFVES